MTGDTLRAALEEMAVELERDRTAYWNNEDVAKWIRSQVAAHPPAEALREALSRPLSDTENMLIDLARQDERKKYAQEAVAREREEIIAEAKSYFGVSTWLEAWAKRIRSRGAARPKLEKLPDYGATMRPLVTAINALIDSHNAMQDAIEILQKERR